MTQPQQPSSSPSRFCSHCGGGLSPRAGFCAQGGGATSAQAAIAPAAERPHTLNAQAYVPSGVLDDLPSMVRTELGRLPAERQSQFLEVYEHRTKKTWLAYILLVLTFHYAYLGKWGVNLIFWGSFFVLVGFGWWIIDIVRTHAMVKISIVTLQLLQLVYCGI